MNFEDINWKSLTLDVVLDQAFVVDTNGEVYLAEQVLTIDLFELTLADYGFKAAKQLLDIRNIMLKYESFVETVEEYADEYGL